MKEFSMFSEWLDAQLQRVLDKKAAALCFNLYEGEETYSFQLIASEYFDEDDLDWPCHEAYTSGEDIFRIHRGSDNELWQDGLKSASELVLMYLKNGKYRDFMHSFEAVAIGFVDGDIVVLAKGNETLDGAVSDYLELYG